MPNTNGHIHLEKQHKKGIWEEYRGEFQYRGHEYLSYDVFCKIWRECFPHVKIRIYKQVSGTCVLCPRLNHHAQLICYSHCREMLHLSYLGISTEQVSRRQAPRNDQQIAFLPPDNLHGGASNLL